MWHRRITPTRSAALLLGAAMALWPALALAVPPNDTCATATVIASLPFTDTPDAAGANSGLPSPTCDSATDPNGRFDVWYQFTPGSNLTFVMTETSSNDTFQAIYTGTCGSLTQVFCTDPESASFAMTGGTAYYIRVGYWFSTGTPTGTYGVTFDVPPPPPANDTCATATVIAPGSLPYSNTVNAASASHDTTDATCNQGTTQRYAIWYSFTPSVTASYILSETSANDTIRAVWTATDPNTPCTTLTQLRCDDAESVTFSMTAGTTYYVSLAMWSSSTAPSGSYTLTLAAVGPPPNDDCATATVIPSLPFNDPSVFASAASGGLPSPTCDDPADPGGRFDVWYKYTPASNVTFVVNELSPIDTFQAIYIGSCGSLAEAYCTTQDGVGYAMVAGITYYIRVGYRWSTGVPDGNYNINFSAAASPGARDIYAVYNGTLSDSAGDTWDIHIVVPSADRFIGWAYLDANDSTAAGFGGAVSSLTSGTFLNLGPMTAGSGGTDPNVGPNSTWMGTAGTTGAGGASGSGFTSGYGAPPLAVANSVEATRVMARILQADSPAAGHAQYDFIAGRLRTSVGATGNLVVDARYAPGTAGRISKILPLAMPCQVITQQPTDKTGCLGTSVSFTVGTAGTNLQHQWRRGTTPLVDGGRISGATTATLTINPIQAGDAGTDYNVVVLNSCGSANSPSVTLTVINPAQFTSHPTSAQLSAGQTLVLTATATGDGTLTYQWRRYGVALADGPTGTGSTIAGSTTNQLTVSNVGSADVGGYDVVASNACSTVASRGAFLSLTPSCATQQPVPLLLAANKNSDDVAAVSAVTGLSIRPVAEAPGKLDYANGLAVDLAGKAFVSSAANGRVQRFDLRNRELELQCSGGGLSGPVDVLLRPSTLLVSSYGTNQVKEYNLDTGLWIRNLVAAGSGGLSGPTGLFARPNGNLLVCSENSGQVLEYDANGAFVRVAAAGGGLSIPADVLLDAAGNLLVASFATDSVKKYDPNGVYLGDFVAAGSGGLDGAGGLCWSPAGNLWVCSRFTSQILEFDGQTGAFVRVFSSGSHLSQPTYIAVAYLCDPDCNGNGVLDQWDIELQRSGDCDHDGTPDECQNIVPSGTAAALDGVDDHLTAGVRPGLNLLNNFTIEAWVRPTATAGVQRFVSDGFFSSSDPNQTAGYGFGMLNGKPVFTTFGVKDYIPTIPTLGVGNWSHVAISMSSGNDVKFYINGNLAAFELGLLPARSSPHAFDIGRNPSGDPNRWQPFGGVIDEVRVWSTVRTDQEILDHFAVPLVGNEPNLVAYWQFDEGTGPTAYDLAGANDATLMGAAWVVSSCARVPCSADADHDGDVDQDDLDLVLFFFGQAVPPGTNGDLTGDGVVTQDDLDVVLFEFGALCL